MKDWRLQGQERFLRGVLLRFEKYKPFRPGWEHDHCEFCGRKFAIEGGDFDEGYVATDNDHWICEQCFPDFRDSFGWVLT